MSSDERLNPESGSFESRPVFYCGQHDSTRSDLTDAQYNYLANVGVSRLQQTALGTSALFLAPLR